MSVVCVVLLCHPCLEGYEKEKRQQVGAKQVLSLPRGGGAQIFGASRTLSRFARFLYLNFEPLFLNFALWFLNFAKGFVPKNLAPPPRLNPVSAPESDQGFLFI